MPALVLATIAGLCVGLVIMAFVLALQDNRRLTAALAEARADVARLKEQRNTAMDAKRAAEQVAREVGSQLEHARREIDNYARAGNRLYRESMEDQQARTLQAALLLKNARRDVDDAYRVLNQKGNA